MKLNQYQYAWIRKLVSGTTRKAKGRLFKSNRACCLGVGLMMCGLDGKKDHINHSDLFDCQSTIDALRLSDSEGSINKKEISSKWKLYLEEKGVNFDDYVTLATLNDSTNMSHTEIGNFINENRKAVFYSGEKYKLV